MDTTSRRVRLLDPHTINQIAAGEVVERPASVVKELVENALDSGATRVEVELKDAGKTLIRVSDDGCGMTYEDAEEAMRRHATSKITSVDDLERIGSLGFRGEALPSIASVSRFTLSTATKDGARSVVRVEGGAPSPLAREAGPRGTTVSVEDLFFNTPARLRFLKSDSSELSACVEAVSRYAMIYPEVAISLTHNDHRVMSTLGTGQRVDAVAEVWGREAARALAPIQTKLGAVEIAGFVSPPHMTRPTRAYQFLSVNRRPVRSRTLIAAMDQAYRDLTPEKRYPMVVLDLRMDPAKVDCNVSPTKIEVKFQQEGQVFEAMRVAIKSALMEHGMIPTAEGIALANEALAAALTPSPGVLGASLQAQAPLVLNLPEDIWVGAQQDPERQGSQPFIDLLDGLRVIGQMMNTFIVAENSRGMVIIDQHVAHERVIYEYLCGLKGPSAIEVQSLLTPITLHLDPRSAPIFWEKIDEIKALGFALDDFGGGTVLVRAAPAALRGKDPAKLLKDIADELADTACSRRLTPTREQIWIMSSCKMAVKAGDPLGLAEMEKLIEDLATTENPYLCPHGRPITVTLARDELLRKFKRL